MGIDESRKLSRSIEERGCGLIGHTTGNDDELHYKTIIEGRFEAKRGKRTPTGTPPLIKKRSLTSPDEGTIRA